MFYTLGQHTSMAVLTKPVIFLTSSMDKMDSTLSKKDNILLINQVKFRVRNYSRVS